MAVHQFTLLPRNVRPQIVPLIQSLLDAPDSDRNEKQNSASAFSLSEVVQTLVLMAAMKCSLSWLVKLKKIDCSRETARKTIRGMTPEVRVLEKRLAAALSCVIPRSVRRGGRIIAIDLHYDCFYGKPDTPGVVGSKKTDGTHWFYGYATAVIVEKGMRYTIGVVAITESTRMVQIVRRLIRQITAAEIPIKGLLMDSGFDSGELILYLKRRKIAYIIPLRRRGSTSNRRNVHFDNPEGTVGEMQWKAEPKQQKVKTDYLVVVHRHPGKKEKKSLYAFGGWSVGTAKKAVRVQSDAKMVKEQYSKRFGIETSYRQMNEFKAMTTSKDVCYRLLLVGVALLLRQVWVLLTSQAAEENAKKSAGSEMTIQWMRWVLLMEGMGELYQKINEEAEEKKSGESSQE